MEAQKRCAANGLYPSALALLLCGCSWEGLCTVGEEAGCPPGSVCYGGEEPKAGKKGVCTEGEFSPEGKLVPTVTWWRLLVGQEEVAPLREEGSQKDNPQAGWASAGAASIEAEVYGLKPGEALKLWTGPHEAEAACMRSGPGKEGRGALWTCHLEAGWSVVEAEAETVDMKLQPGEEGRERPRTYRVDAYPPLAALLAGLPCSVSEGACAGGRRCLPMVGDVGICSGPLPPQEAASFQTFRLCLQARDMQSGMRSMVSGTPTATLAGAAQTLAWRQEVAEPFVSCWEGRLLQVTDIGVAAFGASVGIGADDKLGNRLASTVHAALGRVSCAQEAEGLVFHAVRAPLVFAGGRLAFGTGAGEGATPANNALYFLNVEECALSPGLHVGAVQGPMVALGGSGRVALALGGGGPPGRSGPRLALADARGFIYGEGSMDCAAGTGGSHSGAVFDKGLMLFGMGNPDGTDEAGGKNMWRFAAPANSTEEYASRLMAYTPHAGGQGGRCITQTVEHPTFREKVLDTPVVLTPLQTAEFFPDQEAAGYPLTMIVTIHEMPPEPNPLAMWFFGSVWNRGRFTEPIRLTKPSGIAWGTYEDTEPIEQIWLSGAGLLRGYDELPYSTMVLGEYWRTSPAAVDDKGRAYVVAQTGASSHALLRFAGEAVQVEALPCVVGEDNSPCKVQQICMGLHSQGNGAEGRCQQAPEATSIPFQEAPVGSPLLGHPPDTVMATSPGEVYVVTTAGTVQAFEASTLKHVWSQSLGMHVSPTAQPVLSGSMLWVAGSSGQVRGVHVNSDGLSRSAHWPKAFHDNCNTSTASATYSGKHPNVNIDRPLTLPACYTRPPIP